MRDVFLCIYFLVCLLYFFWLGSNEYESSQANQLFFTRTRFDHEPLNFIWSNKKQQQQTQKQDHSTAINCLFFSLSIILATSSPKISPRIVFHISATHHMPKNSPKLKSCSSPSVCLSQEMLLLCNHLVFQAFIIFCQSGYFLRRLQFPLVYSGKFHAEIQTKQKHNESNHLVIFLMSIKGELFSSYSSLTNDGCHMFSLVPVSILLSYLPFIFLISHCHLLFTFPIPHSHCNSYSPFLFSMLINIFFSPFPFPFHLSYLPFLFPFPILYCHCLIPILLSSSPFPLSFTFHLSYFPFSLPFPILLPYFSLPLPLPIILFTYSTPLSFPLLRELLV